MPHMNGFELSEKILDLDVNIRACFISAAQVNIEFTKRSISKSKEYRMFYQKPVRIII